VRVAIVEDDQDQAELIKLWVEEMGHDCIVYADGAKFSQTFAKESFDLLILDWMLPGMTGIEVLKHIRGSGDNSLPVLFVTAKESEEDIVTALEAGADDYMCKPITRLETKARFNALVRRTVGGDVKVKLDFPPYSIDTDSRTLSLNGELVSLTQKEYELILFLFRNEGRVISRGHLLQVVWGTSPQINTRTVDTHISRLRNKLTINSEATGWELISIYQHGYRLENKSN